MFEFTTQLLRNEMEKPTVKYFMVEFPWEYRRMKEQGLPITEDNVKEVIKNAKV